MAAPKSTDLFVVHRPGSGTNHKVPYSDIKTDVTYTLPAATAAALGGVKQGTNITIASDGTISANIAGAVVYSGTYDPTDGSTSSANFNTTGAGQAPALASGGTPAAGTMFVVSANGNLTTGWGANISNPTPATAGDLLIFDGTNYDLVASQTGGGGTAGVTSVAAIPNTGIQVAGSATAPTVGGIDATDSVKGVVQLADAAAITAGTASRVVDAAQLKAVDDKFTYAAQSDFPTSGGGLMTPATNATKIIAPNVADAVFLRKDFSKLPDA